MSGLLKHVAGALDQASPAEQAAVRRLRTNTGYWNGDRRALEVLREYRAVILAEAEATRATQPFPHPKSPCTCSPSSPRP